MPEILYETDVYFVGMQEHNSETCFVTFCPSFYFSDDYFWAKEFFRSLNLTQICISTRRPAWFPPEEMKRICALCTTWTGGRRVVTYGASMGGYGAIKFSRALSATDVIAFSPQWSIDPDDIERTDTRFANYFDPINDGGRRIRPEDCAGRIFAIFDPLQREDRFHAEMIQSAAEGSALVIPAPFTGHDSILQLSQSHSTRLLMRMVAEKPGTAASDIRDLVRSSRRSSSHYCVSRIEVLLRRAASGQQTWTLAAISRALREDTISGSQTKLYRAALSHLRGRTREKLRELADISSDDLSLIRLRFDDTVRLFRELRFGAGLSYLLGLVDESFPELEGSRLQAVAVMIDLGMREQARRELQALAAGLQDYRWSGAITEAFLRLGDPEPAYRVVLDTLTRDFPTDVKLEAIVELFNQFSEAGYPDEAKRILGKAEELINDARPFVPAVRSKNLDRIASSHRQTGNIANALRVWETALEINPSDAIARIKRAHALVELGRSEFREVVGEENHFPEFWYYASEIWDACGDLVSAATAMEKALENGGEQISCRSRLASVLARSGRNAEAAGEIRRIMQLPLAAHSEHYASLISTAKFIGDAELVDDLCRATGSLPG